MKGTLSVLLLLTLLASAVSKSPYADVNPVLTSQENDDSPQELSSIKEMSAEDWEDSESSDMPSISATFRKLILATSRSEETVRDKFVECVKDFLDKLSKLQKKVPYDSPLWRQIQRCKNGIRVKQFFENFR